MPLLQQLACNYMYATSGFQALVNNGFHTFKHVFSVGIDSYFNSSSCSACLMVMLSEPLNCWSRTWKPIITMVTAPTLPVSSETWYASKSSFQLKSDAMQLKVEVF